MKEVTVIISCKCPVTIDFETNAETIEDLTEEEEEEIDDIINFLFSKRSDE